MEWINIKDKLPRQGREVIVFWRNLSGYKFTVIATRWNYNKIFGKGWGFTYYDIDGSNSLDDSQVTHWMPLPKQPKK